MADFIDFPIFTGVSGDLKHWILWLEEFFVRERFTAMEKMNLAQSLLAGEAESWFYSFKRSIFRSWEHLIDILIWWFGDCNEFGDFIDPELFRLWDKNARILQARRIEKRRKRMKATSIPEKVTIWDTETEALIPTNTIPVMNLTESRDSISATKLIEEANSDSIEKDESHEAKNLVSLEEESITLLQVPVSILEHSLQIHNESPNVCENSQDVVGCDELCELQKDTVSAYVIESAELSSHVIGLDESHLEQLVSNGLQTEMQEVLKLPEPMGLENHKLAGTFTSTPVASVNSISFAVGTDETIFSGLSQTSQVWEPGGVLKLNEPVGLVNQKKSRCLKASMFNFKRKKKRLKRRHNLLKYNYASVRKDLFNTLSRRESWRKHKHENLQIVSGLLGFNVGDFRCHKEYGLARMGNWSQVRVEYSLLQGELFCKNTLPRKPATSSSMLPLYVYQMGVSDIQDNDKEMVADPVSLQLILDDLKSHLWHKWKSKHLRSVYHQTNPSYALNVVNKSVIECTNDRAVLEQIMKGVRPVLLHNPFPMISRVGILVLLAQRVFQKLAAPLLKVLKSWMFKYKPQIEPTVCPFGSQTDHVIFQAVIGEHQQAQSSDPPTMLPEDFWIPAAILEVQFDEFSRREFLMQWQGRDVLENSWLYSMTFVQSYHAFKLEDKLVFGEGSIDTIKQSYCRRKREESESSKAREASGGNRGFAEKN